MLSILSKIIWIASKKIVFLVIKNAPDLGHLPGQDLNLKILGKMAKDILDLGNMIKDTLEILLDPLLLEGAVDTGLDLLPGAVDIDQGLLVALLTIPQKEIDIQDTREIIQDTLEIDTVAGLIILDLPNQGRVIDLHHHVDALLPQNLLKYRILKKETEEQYSANN
jgi:hypothetical protein